MALFGKKKLSLEEILEGIKNLSDEEKAKIGEEMKSLSNTEESVEETDTVEEVETKDDQGEVETEESVETTEEEIPEGTETEGETESIEQTEEVVEESEEEQLPEGESATDEMAQDNRDEIIHGLTDKVNELSAQVQELLELKALMEDYTSKQADNFGYKGNVLGAKKDYRDMSADELKNHIMKGI